MIPEPNAPLPVKLLRIVFFFLAWGLLLSHLIFGADIFLVKVALVLFLIDFACFSKYNPWRLFGYGK